MILLCHLASDLWYYYKGNRSFFRIVLVVFLRHHMFHKLCAIVEGYMNDVGNHHSLKVANYHAFTRSLNHLSLYDLRLPVQWMAVVVWTRLDDLLLLLGEGRTTPEQPDESEGQVQEEQAAEGEGNDSDLFRGSHHRLVTCRTFPPGITPARLIG